MENNLPHLLLSGTESTQEYKYPGGTPKVVFHCPPRDSRPEQAARLRSDLEQAQEDADTKYSDEERGERRGITLEFTGEPGFDLALDSLENRQQGIELSNVRELGNAIKGTVFVPEGRTGYFLQRVEDYATKDTERGDPRHRRLIESISQIRLATVEAFWTDDPGAFPAPNEIMWWEVWLRSGPAQQEQDAAFAEFVAEAASAGIQLSQQAVRFPERIVMLARCDVAAWTKRFNLLNLVAELRKAKEVATEYLQLTPHEQAEFIENAVSRIQAPPADAPGVCILDTGINRGHPLLQLALDEAHVMTVDPNWTAADQNGHGTEMAGLALYGCLTDLLASSSSISLSHRLESVKILPDGGENDPEHYGAITQEAIARAEVESPGRQRASCLTVTADDRDGGLPSAWSGAIDQLCSGAFDDQRRLVFISSGNLPGGPPSNYPKENRELFGIQDPGQSWNAITVGAFTERVQITSPQWDGWQPVAPHGALCPTSTTSLPWLWQDAPFKPDIVMEGGNCAFAPGNSKSDFIDDLSLLTTCVDATGRLLTSSGETSAAAAQAARYAAMIQSHYPECWPETVRGLMIHSATWTDRMCVEFPDGARADRLRVYGYGVPNLETALWSASNSATLIIQGALQPYQRLMTDNGTKIATKDMHLHELPWPLHILEDLGKLRVTMKVTLSYFIEPSPGRRGWTRRHRYQSHGLRFDVKRPTESVDELRQRLTRTAWDDPDVRPDSVGDTHEWELGRNLRSRGSIHSDHWTGTAADLASSGIVAIYPVTGWWRERPHLNRLERLARYSLIVSISTPEVDVDLYSAVVNQVAVSQQIEIANA